MSPASFACEVIVKKKAIAPFILAVFLLCSCTNDLQNTTNYLTTYGIDTAVSSSMSESGLDNNAFNTAEFNHVVNIAVSQDADGSKKVTGTVSEHIQVDALLLTNTDSESLGIGYTYDAKLITYAEKDRTIFVQNGWTLVDSEFRPSSGEYMFIEDEFLDTYSDAEGNLFYCYTMTTFSSFFTSHGSLISSLCGNIEPKYYATEDFDFSTSEEAYETVSSFLEQAGIPIASCYEVKKIPYSELNIQQTIAGVDGMDADLDTSSIPNGWTENENAYYFELFYDFNGFPVANWATGYLMTDGKIPASDETSTLLTGISISAIVTSAGVEYVKVYYTLGDSQVTGKGQMFTVEDALASFSRAMVSPPECESLYEMVNYCIGPMKITRIELSYVLFREFSTKQVSIIPCWQIYSERETGEINEGQQSFPVYSVAYINAITGEYIDTTGFTGSPI